jgi:hypothetical protein
MEPMFTLTYYLQLREEFRSSMTPFTGADCESLPQQDRSPTIRTDASSEYPVEAQNSPMPLARNPRQSVNVEHAFLAITEELNFDLPQPSRVDRIKAGLMEATIGSLLFVALLLTEGLLQYGLIFKL